MRSRLEPHRELIRELRRKRYPYRKIVTILQEQFAVTTSRSALHQFVKVRSRNSGQRRAEFTIPSPASSLSRQQLPAQPYSDPHESAIIGSTPGSFAPAYEKLQGQAANRSKRDSSSPRKRFSFEPAAGLTLSDEDLKLKPRKD